MSAPLPVSANVDGNLNPLTNGVVITINASNVSDLAVISKLLVGFAAAAGTVTAADTILQAFQKIVGNLNNLGTMSLQFANLVNISGGSIDSVTITNLPNPVVGTDAANKNYVDSISAGITPRTGVRVATTANIVLSGVQTIDGVLLVAGDRVLVKNQTAPAENGIYEVAAGAWSRATDANTAGELLFGYYYFVSLGTTQGATSWFIQTAPTVLDTDPVAFGQFAASQVYTAGNGLQLLGNAFSINAGAANTVLSSNGTNSVWTNALILASLQAIAIGDVTPGTGAFTTLSTRLPTGGQVRLLQSGNAVGIYERWQRNGVNQAFIGNGDQVIGGGSPTDFAIDANAGNLILSTAGVPRATLSSAGFTLVGIQINGAAGIAALRIGNTVTGLGTGNGLELSINAAGTESYLYQYENIPIIIGVNSLEVARFLATGFAITGTLNVSGLTTLGQAASLNSTGANDPFIAFNNTGGAFGGFTWNIRPKAATGLLTFSGSADWFTINYATGAAIFTTLAASSDANLRITKNNLRLLINVKDYGALGDGVTNDTVAIAAAVAALPASNAQLYFPPGTYITDTISISGKTGLSIYGDGYGVATIKSRTGSRVLVVSPVVSYLTVKGLTFDGNCAARTAGQQAVVIDGNNILFTENRIINSGEYACMFGGNAATTNVQVTNNYLGDNYADGINFQFVTKGTIAHNIINGVDDDCIAVGWNGLGNASDITVVNNYCRARNDLGTTWGRGIAILGCTDVIVANNTIEEIKQSGLFIAKESAGVRPTRITAEGNRIKGVAIHSGHGVLVYQTTDCNLLNNVVEDPVQGSLIEIADWQNLVIQGGTLRQNNNVFCRAIHCDEGAGWAATWTRLRISNVAVDLLGAATNSGIYLSPHASVTMHTIIINGNTVYQIVAGNYIQVNSTQTGTLAKIVNNVDVTGSRTISPASGGIFTVSNNT